MRLFSLRNTVVLLIVAVGVVSMNEFGSRSSSRYLLGQVAPGAPNLVDSSDTGCLNNDNITIGPTVTFTASCTDESHKVGIFAGSTGTTLLSITPAACSGGQSANMTVTPTSTNGQFTYSARQTTDEGANWGTASATITVVLDTTPPTDPTGANLTPADDATDVSTTANFVMVFNEAICATKVSGGTVVVMSGSDILNSTTFQTILGSGATISPSTTATMSHTTLRVNQQYWIRVSAAFKDLAGNVHNGWSNATTWNFTTTSSTVCGNSATESGEQCDDGNTSNGDCCSSTCTYEASGSSCGTTGACDIQDTCNGSGTCTNNGYQTAGTSCRAATNECDVAETCTGAASTCPTDAFAASTVSCNGTAGDCENQDKCNGSAATCTDNGNKANGTACTDDGLTCSTDLCSSGSCVHAAGNSGTVCEAGDIVGDCYADATCTGSSTACPSRGAATAGTACRADETSTLCDKADTCDGSSTSCTDVFESGVKVTGGVCCAGTSATATNTSCQIACRDGTLDAGEQCDDGNQINNDYCSNVCTSAVCGDGIVQGVAGEQCEPPNANDCRANCTMVTQPPPPPPPPPTSFCGDGIVGSGEQCEPPGTMTCSNACKIIFTPPVSSSSSTSSSPTQVCFPVATGNSLSSPNAVAVPAPLGGFSQFVNTLMSLFGFSPPPPVAWQCSLLIRCCSATGQAYGRTADGTVVTDDNLQGATSDQVTWGLPPKQCAIMGQTIGDIPPPDDSATLNVDESNKGACDFTVEDVPVDDNGDGSYDDDKDGTVDHSEKYICSKKSAAGECETSGGKKYKYQKGGQGSSAGSEPGGGKTFY